MLCTEATSASSRDTFRPHALDGAVLWFQPRTGLNVRWSGPETRRVARRAPRVVLFGITNRCNLACSFCSRDRAARSDWTAESAFDVLAGLARRGTLEVAFGGGEPLAFPGFVELVERLGTETALALHFTTNGTLLDQARVDALRPHVGEIRVSVYEDTPWEDRLEMLAAAGVTFGVNLLASPDRLETLPSLLKRLAEMGCRDVAVLRYVGADKGAHLTLEHERRLAGILMDSPVRVRLAVCFGDRLHPLPRLFEGPGGDCGAGLDFVTITSDRRLKACSFQSSGAPVHTAEDVLDAWTRERARLLRPADLPGCERRLGLCTSMKEGLSDGVRIWRGFSGNNSGDCVLVGRFEEVDDARRYFEDLLPGFRGSHPFSDDWRALLTREGIRLEEGEEGEQGPESMARVGRTVMLHTDMTLEDDFPSLRALLWRRGGRSVYTAVHEHARVELVVGMRFENSEALEAAEVALAVDDIAVLERRALDLYGSVPLHGPGVPVAPEGLGFVHDRIAQLEAVARAHRAAFAAELAPVPEDTPWPRTLAARPAKPGRERLWVSFRTEDKALALASSLDGRAVVGSRWLVVEAARIPPRYGFVVQRAGGAAEWMGGGPVDLSAYFSVPRRSRPLDIAPQDLASGLRPYLLPGDELQTSTQRHHPRADVRTDDPGRALRAFVDFARSRSVDVWIDASPHDRLVEVVERLRQDLGLER